MERKLTIALAGNMNVGKSVIFNDLTGLHQHIGNWPGKTVERAEGTLFYKGYTIDVLDLPGIYSLTTYSIEELISREYIAIEKPDAVINVVDASVLERNLFFTIQLLELGAPMIMALNQVDLAEKKGININHKKLQKLLGILVIPTIATKGIGVDKLVGKSIKTVKGKEKTKPIKIKYGKEIEERVERLTILMKKIKIKYPARWVAVKLLEDDEEIKKIINQIDPTIVSAAEKYAKEIEEIHGHPCSTVITSERYDIANKITREVQQFVPLKELSLEEKLDTVTTHKIFGYPIMIILMLSILFTIFTFGDSLSRLLEGLLVGVRPIVEGMLGTGTITELIWSGMEGLIAVITIVLPYIIPFYLILALLEDSGYLARIAFLMDTAMHKIGLHGKAFIPLMLGYGCNVPACFACRIMETHRERLLAAFVTTLVPCAARTVVILGLVGAFVGMKWALALYVIDLLIIFILGRIAFKILPGEPVGLIMEMPSYRIPSLKAAVKKTWIRAKWYFYMAAPLIILISIIFAILKIAGLLEPIGNIMAPVTVGWLGLPAIAGITLIFGILRKELTLVMLATLFGTTNFAAILTPIQMIVFALVTMLYIPCIATIIALKKEFGWKRASYITVFEIIFAIFIGGVALRFLMLF